MRMSAVVCKPIHGKLKFEDVLCPICQEIYIEPVSLPCKHVVCLQCLEKIVENNSLVCPICRTRIGTFIRLAKNLKKTVDQNFWQKLKKQFPVEIKRKLNGEEDGLARRVLLDQPVSTVLAKKGSIKEEFDEMFHKLKIEEERTRLAEQQASEELAKRIMEEELEQEKQRKRKTEEIEKADVLYIKSMILTENNQRNDLSENGIIQWNDSPSSSPSTSSGSTGRDSISDELRHFTPIFIAPKTPPKQLPNGKLRDMTIIKPINLTSSFNDPPESGFGSVQNKTSLKIMSNNFLRTKPAVVEDVEMKDEGTSSNQNDNHNTSSDLNSNITEELPFSIIKEQELIQKRIKQEQEDLAIALKLHNKWNKEKTQVKRKHGYQLRSAKKNKRS
ncbi:unnamed protein product [Nezara viridula]|uniref:RING-type E3 ubiquitin transferase n=1 Tax=Nezara viridula TaxID=85310 RepID=A0A9P0HKN1_NEZVI|nr:unnamed protein product [Nezara viridula]